MSILFNNLTGSSSLKKLYLSNNGFGMSAVQIMVPFLKNCPNLVELDFRFNQDCFQMIIEALDGSSVESLHFGICRITDITALANFTLPRVKEIRLYYNRICDAPSLESCTSLEVLDLRNNSIGNEGCRGIAKLIANESLSLRELWMDNNEIDDEGIEILANSLTHNKKLDTLALSGNRITERGWGAFLKLLNNVSSIEKTCKSNHTLRKLLFYYNHRFSGSDDNLSSRSEKGKNYVQSVLQINNENLETSYHAAGREKIIARAKIIATQLNSHTRKELCHLQGIEYSYSAVFAGIDPVVLPDLFALVSREHGQTELYYMLVATGPDLFSFWKNKKCQPTTTTTGVCT